MANSKYAAMGKDALTAEIKARRSAGRKLTVDLRGDEDTLRASLDTDDVENGEFVVTSPDPAAVSAPAGAPVVTGDANAPPVLVDAPPSRLAHVLPKDVGAPTKKGSLQNQIAMEAQVTTEPTQPSEEEWDDAPLFKHNGDGLVYQVIKRGTDAFNKPVKARIPAQDSGHPGLYWEGSEADLVQNFTKL